MDEEIGAWEKDIRCRKSGNGFLQKRKFQTKTRGFQMSKKFLDRQLGEERHTGNIRFGNYEESFGQRIIDISIRMLLIKGKSGKIYYIFKSYQKNVR